MNQPFTLQDGIRLRNQMFTDKDLLRLYSLADQVSACQTKHGSKHAFDVRDLSDQLMSRLNQLFPGFLDPWEQEVLVPIAAYTHDIGRAKDIPKHDVLGAGVIGQYLKTTGLPLPYRRRICKAIRNHRANRCLHTEFDDKVWALVVIADKCIGDAERVRGKQARQIRRLKARGLIDQCWQKADQDQMNSLANYAIKKAQVLIDPNDSPEPRFRGAIVLDLKVDEEIATIKQLVSVEWFDEGFHSCSRAAQYLGFAFRLQINGIRYFWSKPDKGWRKVQSIAIPRS